MDRSAFVGVTSGGLCGSAKVQRSAVCLKMSAAPSGEMDRRSVLLLGTAMASLAFVGAPGNALADGAVSDATRKRARVIYGARVMDLTPEIEKLPELAEKGSWVQILNMVSSDKKKPGSLVGMKNSFILFTSGAYAGFKQSQVELTNAQNILFDAVSKLENAAKSKNTKVAQLAANEIVKSFNEYKAVGELKPNPFAGEPGQVWSSDFAATRKM
eukprot:CAMPEP_0182448012 /NCGR_PEP_ID=MMETSP1172-20130603/22680_1 /TAXON_ID=708627 /ORGANISM="Timspurckia oligopyrenoides, Strain CCMP3278" /LENGTH=213 /DNA_ID=CAMNT_0024644703 /DNA_START=152 /DNA_END=790 /DNA_ORIENTATION=+